MKKTTLIILVIVLSSINLHGQTPVFDIEDLQNTTQEINGAYHKDTNNQLNLFEGTYLYINGTTSLKIILQKKVMSSMNGFFYEDLIVGEYQYIENGIEKINLLDNININYPNQNKHSISGNSIFTGTELCSDCLPNEKHLQIGLSENSTQNWATMQIRKLTINGMEAIRVRVNWQITAQLDGAPQLPHPSFPGGYYTLIKQ